MQSVFVQGEFSIHALTHKLVYKMEDSNENVDVSTRFRNLILENTNNLANENKNDTGEELMDDEYFNISDLPNVLIITNVPEVVFDHDGAKQQFESLFLSLDETCSFTYLKSFRRARVECASSDTALQARITLNEVPVCGQPIKCFFAQPVKLFGDKNPHLVPPLPQRTFLISPPASPPVGWEPIHEQAPVLLDYDLISAVANLAPGGEHELHQATDSQPSIIVSVCEDPSDFEVRPKKIAQTRRPIN